MGGLWQFFTDPDIDSRLRAGEHQVDVVRKHWVAYWRFALEFLAVVVCIALYAASTPGPGWVLFWLAACLALHASWLFVCLQSDFFVVTNRRVFRVQGPLGRRFATLPATRIVDYSVDQSLWGRLCGYGHFVFESAGQDQALREIRYVGDPTGRSDRIQDVVQPDMEGSSNSSGPGWQDD